MQPNVDLQSYYIDNTHQMLLITVFGQTPANTLQYNVLMAGDVPFFVIQGKRMLAANKALNAPDDRHAAYIMFKNLDMLHDENKYSDMVRFHLQKDQPYIFDRKKSNNVLN